MSGRRTGNRRRLILLLVLLVLAFVISRALPAKAREEIEEETEVAVDPDELYMLSHLICGESEGCSWDMKISVGSVVLNRVKDPRFPDTISEVIFQPGQYSCTWDGNYYREPSQDTVDAALYLLKNGPAIDSSVVWQAEFPQGRGVYDVIANQYFCY